MKIIQACWKKTLWRAPAHPQPHSHTLALAHGVQLAWKYVVESAGNDARLAIIYSLPVYGALVAQFLLLSFLPHSAEERMTETMMFI